MWHEHCRTAHIRESYCSLARCAMQWLIWFGVVRMAVGIACTKAVPHVSCR